MEVIKRFALILGATICLSSCSLNPSYQATGALGVVIERASGSVKIIDTINRTAITTIDGLGDLSHASAVFSKDEKYVYIFGRDGGLTKINLLSQSIEKRVLQSGNSIGGAISQNGKYVAVSNYTPGGVKIFDSDSLTLLADIPATEIQGNKNSKVVGLVDAPGNRFVFSLFDSNEIWVAQPEKSQWTVTKFKDIGKKPYDALLTPDGRYYIAGLFGEDGMALLDLWQMDKGVTRILPNYGKGEERLPVYKMPHLEGWAISGNKAYVPAVGQHLVLVIDMNTWEEIDRIPVLGQPVFVMARPGGRHIWVNFALPDNDHIQIIDSLNNQVIKELQPGKGVLHMEFYPRGEAVWLSVRDENQLQVYDTQEYSILESIPAKSPSGIFFTTRAHKLGL